MEVTMHLHQHKAERDTSPFLSLEGILIGHPAISKRGLIYLEKQQIF
jgi:hypothetical protein